MREATTLSAVLANWHLYNLPGTTLYIISHNHPILTVLAIPNADTGDLRQLFKDDIDTTGVAGVDYFINKKSKLQQDLYQYH